MLTIKTYSDLNLQEEDIPETLPDLAQKIFEADTSRIENVVDTIILPSLIKN